MRNFLAVLKNLRIVCTVKFLQISFDTSPLFYLHYDSFSFLPIRSMFFSKYIVGKE